MLCRFGVGRVSNSFTHEGYRRRSWQGARQERQAGGSGSDGLRGLALL